MNNVKELLQDRGIQVKEAGRDYLIKCINPEHSDSNPSMRVDKITGIYQCFSCGAKGNMFQHLGAEPNPIDIAVSKLQGKIRDLMVTTNLVFPADAVPFAKDYRDIKKETYIEAEAFTTFSIQELADRLCFPLRDMRGNIKAFIGRALHSDLSAKYLFYPAHVKVPIFPVSPEVYKNSLIIVEGIFDALNLQDKGLTNVICAFGTTSLLKSYKDKLSHFKILGVNKFYIMFDGDKAGQSAAKKLETILNENGFNAETVELPKDRDPGDLSAAEVMILKTGIYGDESSDS